MVTQGSETAAHLSCCKVALFCGYNMVAEVHEDFQVLHTSITQMIDTLTPVCTGVLHVGSYAHVAIMMSVRLFVICTWDLIVT